MRLGRLTILACSLSLAASAASAAPATTSGSVALALAGVVAPYSPLPDAEKSGRRLQRRRQGLLCADHRLPTRWSVAPATSTSPALLRADIRRQQPHREGREANAIHHRARGCPRDGAAGV